MSGAPKTIKPMPGRPPLPPPLPNLPLGGLTWRCRWLGCLFDLERVNAWWCQWRCRWCGLSNGNECRPLEQCPTCGRAIEPISKASC